MNENGNTPAVDWATMPEWIDVKLASQQSGYTADYLRQLMRQGRIKGDKRGTMWWINRDSLQEYLATIEALGSKKHDPRGAPELTHESE